MYVCVCDVCICVYVCPAPLTNQSWVYVFSLAREPQIIKVGFTNLQDPGDRLKKYTGRNWMGNVYILQKVPNGYVVCVCVCLYAYIFLHLLTVLFLSFFFYMFVFTGKMPKQFSKTS